MDANGLLSDPKQISDLALAGLRSTEGDPDRRLAWVNSICILFLLIGFAGSTPVRMKIKPLPPSEDANVAIMRLLLAEKLSVNTIAYRLRISEYNVSKHLRILKEAGLLEMDKSGRQRLYGVTHRLRDELAANRNVLELPCCTFRFDNLPR